MEKKEDLRVRKTKQNIRAAFFDLLKERGLDKLTVREILEAAQINRATFYRYYRDKYDLAEQVTKEYTDELMGLIEPRFNEKNSREETFAIIYSVYNYIRNNRGEILILWENEGSVIHLQKDMEDLLYSLCLSRLEKENADAAIEREYTATIYAALVMATIRWNIERDRDLDLKVMFDYVREATQSTLL